MKRLLTTLVILTGLIGSAGAVWADDFDKGYVAYKVGDYAKAVSGFARELSSEMRTLRYVLATCTIRAKASLRMILKR